MLKVSLTRKDIEQIVVSEIVEIVREKTGDPAAQVEVSIEQRLGSNLGLSSLDLAQLVATLEERLRCDPFRERVAITSVRTVGELCDAYEQFISGAPESDDELRETRDRAASRRRSAHGS